MAPMESGIAVGLKKGFVVTKREQKQRPVHRKGKLAPRLKAIREVIREVAGFAPYEKRLIELIKIGNAATFKRALKFSKKRLGTHRRGKAKREEIQNVVIQQRKQAKAAGQ